MIARLTGILIEKEPSGLLIDVNGVGYEMQAPLSTIVNLPDVGEQVTVFTHLSISENAHNLFAFAGLRDRQLFRELIKVNGVGPKLGVAILSGMNADEFVSVVHHGDASMLVKLPGVGKKTAERLLIEMRDRLKEWDSPTLSSSVEGSSSELPPSKDVEKEAVSALVALGYKPQEASRAINAIDEQLRQAASSSSDIIRLALQNIGK